MSGRPTEPVGSTAPSVDDGKCDHPEWKPVDGYMMCTTCKLAQYFNPLTREWKYV